MLGVGLSAPTLFDEASEAALVRLAGFLGSLCLPHSLLHWIEHQGRRWRLRHLGIAPFRLALGVVVE